MKIKGIIFDLDGTLTLTQYLHYQALKHTFAEYGIEYSQAEDLKNFAGKGSKHTCEVVLTASAAKPGYTGNKPTVEEFKKCSAKKKKYYDELLEKTEIKLVPGIESFLANADAKGIKMIVATGNKIDATQIILGRTGIARYFKGIVAQHDVKNQKPAPDIYLLAAEKLGLPVSECIVFEDVPNGVKGAKAGNFYCIGLTTGSTEEELKAAGADTVISDYNDPKIKNLI